MRALLQALRNKVLLAYVAVYAVGLWHLSRQPGFEPAEALGVLVIVGVIFSSLALLVTRRAQPLPLAVKSPAAELGLLLAWMLPLAAFLVWGLGTLRSAVPTEPAQSLAIAAAKLMMVVVIPGLLCMRGWGYRIGELAPVGLRWNQLKPALCMSLAGLLMQGVLGRGLRDLSQAQVPVLIAAIAAPLAFLWLALEVGLVEEFFFRVLLQTRLARVFGSELSGIIAAAALFGLGARAGTLPADRGHWGSARGLAFPGERAVVFDRDNVGRLRVSGCALVTDPQLRGRGDGPRCHRFDPQPVALHPGLAPVLSSKAARLG